MGFRFPFIIVTVVKMSVQLQMSMISELFCWFLTAVLGWMKMTLQILIFITVRTARRPMASPHVSSNQLSSKSYFTHCLKKAPDHIRFGQFGAVWSKSGVDYFSSL